MSEFEQEGEQGFDPGTDTGEPYGPGWDGEAGFEPELESMDAGAYEEAVRQIVAESIAAEHGERQRVADGAAEAERLVTDLASELGLEAPDVEALNWAASSDVLAVASGLLAQAGYRPDQAEAFLRERGDVGGFGLVAEVYGISTAELARQALAAAVHQAFAAAPSRGDESAVLAKYQRLGAAGPVEGGRSPGRPSQAGAYPPWAADLINRV